MLRRGRLGYRRGTGTHLLAGQAAKHFPVHPHILNQKANLSNSLIEFRNRPVRLNGQFPLTDGIHQLRLSAEGIRGKRAHVSRSHH